MGASDLTSDPTQGDDLIAESLATESVPERVAYAAGVLLNAADFGDEQLYHRARQARAFAALYGHGTMAGLRVSCPVADNPVFEVRVAPGLALDRLGRLIEVRRPQCLSLTRWLAARQALAAADALRVALVTGTREDVAGDKRLALDVFARFIVCRHGARPVFAEGPFNATDDTAPSRLADSFELTLELAAVERVHPDDPDDTSTMLALPRPRSSKLDAMLLAMRSISDPDQLELARRAWCVESALDAWPEAAVDNAARLPKLREHAAAADWDRVLLARLSVPVVQAAANDFPTLDLARALAAGAPTDLADNLLRPVVFNPYSWQGAI